MTSGFLSHLPPLNKLEPHMHGMVSAAYSRMKWTYTQKSRIIVSHKHPRSEIYMQAPKVDLYCQPLRRANTP